MKIAFVSDAIYPYNKGGKEKRLYELTTRLSAAGHDIHIYTMHWWQSAEGARVEQGVTLHALCKRYDMYNGDRRSIKQGIFFGLACFKLLGEHFDAIDVDHMPFFPIVSTWLVCKLKRKKMIGTWHEALTTDDWLQYMGRSGYIAALIERICIKLPHTIIAASKTTKKNLTTHHNRTRNIDLVESGVDTAAIQAVQPTSQPCDILYFGRLVKDKNVDKLIQAVALVAKKLPAVQCVIFGTGPEEQGLKKLITHHNLQHTVSLRQPLDAAEDVYAYMKKAGVFVLPSVREGFGIVALEALACGTPVITTDAPANAARYLINESKNGSVVDLSPEALATAIEHWLTSKPDTSISRTAASYDWDYLAKKQLKIYGATA